MNRRSLVHAVTLLALLATAPAADAEVLSAQLTDDSFDGGSAGRDITGGSMSYDTGGRLTGALELRGAPTAADDVLATVHLGTVSGTTCGPPAALLGASLVSDFAEWNLEGSASGPATRSLVGSTLTIDASAPQLANLAQRCVWAQVVGSDKTDGWETLAGAQPQGPPPQPPPQNPPAQQPTPPAKVPVAKAPPPAARLAIAGAARTVKRNRWVRVRVRVSNTGNAIARKVQLSLGKARGVSAEPRSASWRTLAAGKSATTTVRLKLSSKAKRSATVRLRVKAAGRLTASGAITLKLATKRKAAPKKRKPSRKAAPKGPLEGRQFWGTVNHVDWAWDNRGVYFVDGEWAYEGLPKSGLPRCTAVTEEVDRNGKATDDGCRRYTFDAATGALTVGNLKGTYEGGRLTLDDVKMEEVETPRPGTRLQVDLLHRSFQGFCGLITGCTTSLETLVLSSDGQFARSASTTSTLGDGFATPFVAIGSYPPDERGGYEILPRGVIRLAYADGSVKTHTIAIFRNDDGQPDPATAGVLLDETNFYTEDD